MKKISLQNEFFYRDIKDFSVDSAFEDKNSSDSEKVGVELAQTGKTRRDRHFFHNVKLQLMTQFAEIIDRTQMDVRSVVPMIRYLRGPRHFSTEHQLKPAAEMSKIDNTYRRKFTYTDDLFQ